MQLNSSFGFRPFNSNDQMILVVTYAGNENTTERAGVEK